jgi:hypothetical protein
MGKSFRPHILTSKVISITFVTWRRSCTKSFEVKLILVSIKQNKSCWISIFNTCAYGLMFTFVFIVFKTLIQ